MTEHYYDNLYTVNEKIMERKVHVFSLNSTFSFFTSCS